MAKRGTYQPVRWTCDFAAKEFGSDEGTLRKRLLADEVLPGPDGKYSTRQIAGALFNDISAAKLRNVQLEGDLLEMEKRQKLGELVSADEVRSVLRSWLTGARQVIRYDSHLSREAKEALLEELKEISLTRPTDEKPDTDEEPET